MKIPCSYTHTKTISKWLVYTFPSFRVRTDFLTGQSDRQIERRWTILLNQAHFTAHTRTTHTIVLATYINVGGKLHPFPSTNYVRAYFFISFVHAGVLMYVWMHKGTAGSLTLSFVRLGRRGSQTIIDLFFLSLSLLPAAATASDVTCVVQWVSCDSCMEEKTNQCSAVQQQ